jgi:NAD(P)-dependent dehydrogenase (short-subunit alcohol dehydrogenase family)
MVMVSLDKKVAIVTGASRGLGAAAARALAEAGADLVLVGRTTPQLDELKDELSRAFGNSERKILVVTADVSDETAVEEATDRVMTEFGRVDVLVSSAGIATPAPLLETTLSDLRRTIDVNLVGMMLCARAFGAHMVAQREGVIINMGSISGLIGEPDIAAYAATKGAVHAFTRALAVEWARHGVRVNAIAPGYFRTDLNKAALDDAQIGPKILHQIPLRRVGQPKEIGPLVVYLASDQAAFMTGSTIVIDGGQTAR